MFGPSAEKALSIVVAVVALSALGNDLCVCLTDTALQLIVRLRRLCYIDQSSLLMDEVSMYLSIGAFHFLPR
jgi:hypothetical protein